VVSTLRCTIRGQKRTKIRAGDQNHGTETFFHVLRFSNLFISFCSNTGWLEFRKPIHLLAKLIQFYVPSPKLRHWTFRYCWRLDGEKKEGFLIYIFSLTNVETHLWLSKFCPIPYRAPLFCSWSPLEVKHPGTFRQIVTFFGYPDFVQYQVEHQSFVPDHPWKLIHSASGPLCQIVPFFY